MKCDCLKKYIAYLYHEVARKYFYGEFPKEKTSNLPKNGMHNRSCFHLLFSQKKKQKEKMERVTALIPKTKRRHIWYKKILKILSVGSLPII